jgi:hypothetical protein
MLEGRYVYAVVPSTAQLPAGTLGVDGEPLELVRSDDLAAVAGLAHDERAERTRERLLRHNVVVDAVRLRGPALPVRFGTVLRGKAQISASLAQRRDVLRRDLARLGRKFELDLVVLAASPALSQARESEHVAPLLSNLRGAGPGVRYLRERMRAQRKERVLEERLRAATRPIDEALTHHAGEIRWTFRGTPPIACSAAYLVAPASIQPFCAAFARLRDDRPEFSLLLGKPLAPYSFVTVAEQHSLERISLEG